MTVAELIAQLQKLHGDEIVVVDGGDGVGFVRARDTISAYTDHFGARVGARRVSAAIISMEERDFG